MKKLISLMALAILLFHANVNAQSRNVTIKNEIGCEIYWDVVAIRRLRTHGYPLTHLFNVMIGIGLMHT
jgi:hypothetical protein